MRPGLSLRTASCPVYMPGDAGYLDAVTTWGRPVAHATPGAVVRPSTVHDVVDVVARIREDGLDVAVRGAGHHVAGSATATDGVVVDMRAFSTIERISERVVRVGAGCTWESATRAALETGGMIPAGNDSSTGVVGLALGGGIGPLSRSWGLTCDRIRSVGLVDGRANFRRIDDVSDGEVLAVLRGAGRGLGIVTDIEFESLPCEPTVPTAQVVFDATDSAPCLMAWVAAAARSTVETNSQITMRTFGDSPAMPPEIRGRRAAVVGAIFTGDANNAAKQLAPFRELGGTLLDVSGEVPLAETARPWRSGLGATSTAHFLNNLNGASITRLAALAEQAPPGGTLTIRALGGRIHEVDRATSVFAHRDAAFQVIAQAEWTKHEDAESARSWCDAADLTLNAIGSTGIYGNFYGDVGTFADRRSLAYGDTNRIDRALAECDPAGIFRRLAFRP